MSNYNLEELNDKTIAWSKDRGIISNGTAPVQMLKLVSEMGELADNIAKGNDIKDDIGDCIVVLCNIAAIKGLTIEECWNIAYDDIKDRKGFLTSSGLFVKDTDPNYGEIMAKENNDIEGQERISFE